MSNRARIQRIREETADTVKSFEETFKEVDRLVDQNASDSEIDAAIAESGIPQDAFIDAYQRYTDAGGIVDFGAGRSLLQGLTFGFADELEASLPSAVTGLEGDYEQRVGQIRAGQTAFEAAQPGTALAAEVAGALPSMLIPGVGGARLAQMGGRAPSLARTMAYGAGIGAAEGAIGGAGRGETMGGRGQRALVEGGIGLGLGALAPAAVTGASSLLGGRRGIDELATAQMTRAIPEERMPQVQEEVQRRIDVGDTMPETLTDITGDTAQAELRGISGRFPETRGQISQTLGGRTETQAPRIESQIERQAGVAPEQSIELQDLVARQMDDAAQDYQRLRDQYQSVDVSDMRGLFNSPAFQRNYNQVIETMQNRAAAGEVTPEVLQKLEGKMSYNEFMEAIRRGDRVEVPFDFLERMKRRIDAEAGVAKRRGDRETADELTSLRRSFVSAIDDRVPEYAQARQKFAGQAEVQDALETGSGFDKMTPASIESTLERMTDSEKRAFITGAVQKLRETIENTRDRTDLVNKLIGTPGQQKRLATLMGGEDSAQYKAFIDSLQREARMKGTERAVVEGSRTAPMMQDIERAGMPVSQIVEALVNPVSVASPTAIGEMLANTVSRIFNRSRRARDTAGEVTRRLLETDPRRQMDILRQMQGSREQAERTAQMMQQMGITAGAAAGQVPSLLDAGE